VKRLSFRLSQAVAGGRAARAAPESREVVLERLLRKRAAAFQAGLDDQEQMLRDQILWSLPIDRDPAGEAEVSDPTQS
jgi:hypothetical protein